MLLGEDAFIGAICIVGAQAKLDWLAECKFFELDDSEADKQESFVGIVCCLKLCHCEAEHYCKNSVPFVKPFLVSQVIFLFFFPFFFYPSITQNMH